MKNFASRRFLRLLVSRKAFWDTVEGLSKMADGPAGFHFDELNKVRVLEPEISQQTQELKEECKEFVDSKSELFLRKMCEAKLK